MQLQQAEAPMRRAEIEGLAKRWIAAWRDGSPERFDEVEAPDFCDGSAAGQDAGNAGLRATVAALHRAFAALEITADLVTADAALGLATIRWTASGRHIRPFLGIAPSGGRVRFHGIEVIR